MSVKTCPRCGSLQARGQFCTECGYDLRQVKAEDIVIPDVKRPAGQSYNALRFTASMLILLGWLAIAFSVGSACVVYFGLAGLGAIFTQGTGVNASGVGTFAGFVSSAFALFFGVVGGLGSIAGGQLILLFLDIGDDVRRIAGK